MREREIEKKLKLEVECLGCLCMKWVSPGCTGVPDRIVILPGGKIVFVELKTPTGQLRTRQQLILEKLKNLGCKVRVINSLEGVQQFIAEIKDEAF